MEWKTISDDFPKYSVSSCGMIRNDGTGYLFKLQSISGGYKRVSLVDKDGKQRYKLVHVLVAHAWLGVKPKGTVIDHIDRNTSNNSVFNLRYVSQKENCQNKKHCHNKSRAVLQYTLDGVFVKRWNRIIDAPFSRQNIVSACRGKLKSVGGFIWKYEDINAGEWREIDGISVSSEGFVKLKSGKTTKGWLSKNGYYTIRVDDRFYMVHRLVCAAFNGSTSAEMTVHHIDGDKKNNRFDNLKWVTQAQNNSYIDRSSHRDIRRVSVKRIALNNAETVYESIDEAAKVNGISKGNICMVCRGQRKNAGGFRWVYL